VSDPLMSEPLILVVSHGGLAASLVQTARQIAGQVDALLACKLADNETAVELAERLRALVRNRPALILTDLAGGTPHQAALRVARQSRTHQVEVLSGANLAMLCEAILSRRPESRRRPEAPLRQLAQQALRAAQCDLVLWGDDG